MVKIIKKIIIVTTLLISSALAFYNGNATGTPWIGVPTGGDLFATFNVGAQAFQNLNEASVNVTTLKIHEVFISANIAVGQTETAYYVVENTGDAVAVAITSASLRFYKPNTGNVTVGHYTVVPVDAYPLSVPAGGRVTLSFQVTPTTARTTGNYIVDGYVATGVGANDINYNMWSTEFTAAVTPSYTREAPATLNIAYLEITSPSAVATPNPPIVSGGQSFWVSFNVANLGDSNIVGTPQVQIEWPAIINTPTITTQSFIIGQPITFNLTASANAWGAGIITASIINTVPIHPVDESTGLTVNYLNRVATMSISVIRPAQLDILSVTVPTTQVTAYDPGPVTVDVQVQNVGSADAVINVLNSDLGFIVSGNDLTATYLFNPVPSAAMLITENQIITVSYVISTFGGGAGICTVNVTLNATDQLSGFVTSDAATAAEVATYNVTANAGVMLGQVWIDRDPVGYLGSFEVYVPIAGIYPGETVNVMPATTDLTISLTAGGPNVAGVSFNVTAVIPTNFQIVGVQSAVITYSVTALSDAVSGDYTIGTLPGFPVATNNTTAQDVSDPDGAVPTTTATYDPISPNVVTASPNNTLFATPNFGTTPIYVISPTTNFQLLIEFSETMNATGVPYVTFNMTGATPTFNAGVWNGPTNNIFMSNGMTLTALNQGFVTISVLSGVYDVAGNSLVPTYDFFTFYIDAQSPTGAVTINSGETITSNPLVTLNFSIGDDFSATANMFMYIFGLPTSNVSANPGIAVNTWLPYQQEVTLNLESASFGTKNISVMFRDEAGNTSNVYSDDIFLDTDTIVWITPSDNAIISTNVLLRTQTSIFADHVDYYVSVNNTMIPISLNVAVDSATGVCDYIWNNSYTTNNAWLVAVASGNTIVNPTANIINITIDNTDPDVTINTPINGQYVYGEVIISGIATDNALITSIGRIDISTDNGTTWAPAVGTDSWSITFNVPAADPNFTTYNIRARAYDLAGNLKITATTSVLKFDGAPSINVTAPSANPYMKNTFTLSGNVTSVLPLDRVDIAFNDPSWILPVTATGTSNWVVTFNINDLLIWSGQANTINITAYTLTTPSIITTLNFPITIDKTAPNIVSTNLNTINFVAGTLNVFGEYNDSHSGVSEVQINIDSAGWNTVSTSSNYFYYPLGITKAEGLTYNIELRAIDYTYITPNISATSSFVVTVDYSVLPSGNFVSPVSGSYVNYDTYITGTANALGGVDTVYVSFDNGTNWATANGTNNWNYTWTVPTIDAHGTTYNPILRIVGSGGIEGMPSPAITTTYIKDIYGPSSVILNLTNGMYAASTPVPILFRTYTEGALVSASYVIVDGVSYNATMTSALTQNVQWLCNWDYTGLPGSVHEIYVISQDTAGNWERSNSINIRTIPTRIITEPLPDSQIITGSTMSTNPVYATSVNTVLISDLNTANITAVYVEGVPRTPSFNGANLLVTLNAIEDVYVIAVIESDGLSTTAHYQPVVYDVTPPTVNVDFNGVTRYYPNCYIAPNETFMINVLDRTASGADYGSGFSASPEFSYISPNYRPAGIIQRSVYDTGTTTNNAISGDSFDAYNELLTFPVNLAVGQVYDLVVYVVDNAGNQLLVTFNVTGMIVDNTATGLSGGIDDDQLITAYPNPYDPNNSSERLRFTYYLRDNAVKTKVYIYNEVAELLEIISINGPGQAGTKAGYNEVYWDARDKFRRELSNGIYLYVLVVEGQKKKDIAKGKLVILRR